MRLWHAKHFTWFHWQLQKPPTWQGSRHESPSEATPLALFPALAGAQEFSPVYYSCQWGTEKKTLSHNKICLETDIYCMCCTCKNKKNICVSPYPLITHCNKYCRLKLSNIWAYLLVGSVQAFLPTLPALRCGAGSPCTEHLLYPDMQNT